MEGIVKQNALQIVGDYVTPPGMIDFKLPTDMIKEMMQRVLDNPKDKDLISGLQAMVDGAKGIIEAGKEQNNQARTLIDLIKVNHKLDMI
jgi:hypothetical protein